MIIKQSILFCLISLIIQVQSFATFCFSTCNIRSCTKPDYTKCQTCSTGFVRDPAITSPEGPCIAQTYATLETGPKYIPVGKTSDVNYDLKSITTVQAQTVVSNATMNCFKDANNNYTFFGDLVTNAILTVTHPGVSDPLIHFWKIRIRAGVITIEDVDTTTRMTVTFTTNATEPFLVVSLDPTGMDANSKVCGGGQDQRYKAFDTQWFYNDTSAMEFKLTVVNNTKASTWGMMYFIVQVRRCHVYCTGCWGDDRNVCYSCDYINYQAMLSNTTCGLTCAIGYGNNTSTPDTCILCQVNCTSCLDLATQCISCYPTYYLYDDGTTISCIKPCPSHYFINYTGNDFCQVCDSNCLQCTNRSTKCLSCYPGFYLYPADSVCYNPCPLQTYSDNGTTTCIGCYKYCYQCVGNSTYCTICDTNGSWISYLLNNTCLVDCGVGYYQDNNGSTAGPNTCVACNITCLTCNFNSNYCLSCVPGFYLLNNTCNLTCPQPAYFPDSNIWQCIDCSVACVNLQMDLYFKNNLKDQIICDLTFTKDLNWTAIDIENFIVISVVDPLITINNFNVDYQVITSKIFRITLIPKGYIFIYNVTFTFTTIAFNGTYDHASNGYPFQDANYGKTASLTWFLIKAPSLSNLQKNIIDSVSKLSDKIIAFTTLPGVQQIKKTGIFAMILGGAQATSTSCLINTIPAQNFYQGVRVWASFVFYDVPPWEQNSKKNKLIVAPQADTVIADARLLQEIHNRKLFDKSKVQWRFQRTGHTTFFIFDTYMNIFLMLICWVLVIIANKCIKNKTDSKKLVANFYSFMHKVHQISIFYISLSTLLQWMYFDAASGQRWISFILCIIFNVYFLMYQLYIYYDMINYPVAEIGNKQYEFYCLRYSSLLKNIRFIEYDKTQPWSMKHWFRPYNFHILSYYKKFLMMIALPIFYSTLYMQTYCLCAIQLFQIIRFIVVWPFKSKVRNLIRLGLQFLFFVFLGTIVIQTMMVKQIMLSDPNTLQFAVDIFYKIGWVGFCAVFVFNIGFLTIFIYDCVNGCRKSNIQMMDEARKFYYMQRLNTYEQENQDVPIALINKWVKLGNLNNRRYDELPDINLRIQYFKIIKSNNAYQIQMKKLNQIFMNVEFNFQKQNNITAGKKTSKRFTLNKLLSPQFFYLIDSLYKKYSSTNTFENLIIKTFQRVPQSQYKPGDKVELDPKLMQQKVQLETYNGHTKSIKLPQLLEGFPIPYEDVKQFL